MDRMPVSDLTDAGHVALTSMLGTGRVIGQDETGRSVIAVAVDDWSLHRFGIPGTRLVTNRIRGRRKR